MKFEPNLPQQTNQPTKGTNMGTMEELSREFHGRDEDEKLVMGYLASGNSAYDILKLLIEHMQMSKDGWNDYVDQIKADFAEQDRELGEVGGTKKGLLNAYDELGNSINSPLVG